MVRQDISKKRGLLIVLAITCVTIAIAEYIGLRGKFEDLTFLTVMVFAPLILLYRSRWTKWQFWLTLSVTLALHVMAVTVFSQGVSMGPVGVPGLLLTAIGIFEGSLIIVAWDRLQERSKSHDDGR